MENATPATPAQLTKEEIEERTRESKLDIRHSPEMGKIAMSLAKAQGAMKNPTKNITKTITHKTGGSHQISYSSLDVVLDTIRKPLSDNEIAFMQIPAVSNFDGNNILVTMLIHSSGQFIEGKFPLPRGLSAQDTGIAITYARRYTIQSMLGIFGETDQDAEIEADKENAKAEQEKKEAEEKAAKKLEDLKAKTKKSAVKQEEKKEEKEDDLDMSPPHEQPPAQEKRQIDKRLMFLLGRDHVGLDKFMAWGSVKNFPKDMKPEDLKYDFVSTVVKNWDKVLTAIKEMK